LQELQRPRHPEVLAWTALVLLAAVAGEGVECPSADFGRLVVESADESGDRLLVEQAIEEVDTEASDDRVLMPEPTPDGGQGRWT